MKSNIEKFIASHFIGQECKADLAFHPQLQMLNKWASDLDIQVFVTHSFRELSRRITGTIVEPASHSCHYVGHAIDFNLFSKEIGFINSTKLGLYPGKIDWGLHMSNKLPIEAQQFIARIRKHPVLRWGGDFKNDPDPIHIDDNLWYRDPKLWEEKFYEINY